MRNAAHPPEYADPFMWGWVRIPNSSFLIPNSDVVRAATLSP